jgi:hypothetical protein
MYAEPEGCVEQQATLYKLWFVSYVINLPDRILTILGLRFKAYSSSGDCRQIVTGVSERGSETGIRYWIQPHASNRVQPRPKATKAKVMEFATTHVSQDSFY